MGVVRNIVSGVVNVAKGIGRVAVGALTLRPGKIWEGLKQGFGGVCQFAMGALPIAGLALGGVGLLGLGGMGPLMGGLAGKLGLGGLTSAFSGIGGQLAGSFGGLFSGAGSFLSSGMSMFSGLGPALGLGAQAAQVGGACAGAGVFGGGLGTFMMAAPMISMGMNMMGGLLA
jgi:hypothetical protein